MLKEKPPYHSRRSFAVPSVPARRPDSALFPQMLSDDHMEITEDKFTDVSPPALDDDSLINEYDYLESPVTTLVASAEDGPDDMSIHHILDAYNIFSARLRCIAQTLVVSPSVWPALEVIKLNNAALCQCLWRDVKRAFVEAFPRNILNAMDIPDSMNSTYDASPTEIQKTRDSSALCQSALQLLSIILRFPALYAMFPSNRLDQLCDLIMKIAASSSIPSLSGSKTKALALWILATMRFPSPALTSKASQLVMVLKDTLEYSPDITAMSDSLRAIDNLLCVSSGAVLEPFTALLPSVLPHIMSSSLGVRTHTALALCAYVRSLTSACTSGKYGRSWTAAGAHAKDFIMSQVPRQRDVRNPSPGRLEELLVEALSSKEASPVGQGPSWALTVLGCLIILSSGHLFGHRRTLVLIINTLALAARHRRSLVRRLHAWVWRCLIWAFARPGSPSEDGGAHDDTSAHEVPKSRDSAFLLLRQELHDGAGIALVASLLSPPTGATRPGVSPGNDVSKALSVVEDMLTSSAHKTHTDGRSTLAQLMGATNSPTSPSSLPQIDSDPYLVKELFDGTTLKLDWKELCLLVPDAGKFDVGSVRSLTEAEIEHYWDDIIKLWTICVRRTLSEGVTSFPMKGDEIRIWQTLLLANAQLTQESRHLMSPPACAQKAVTIIVNFLADPSLNATKLPSSHTQLSVLVLGKQLWKVMRNVFAPSWLTVAAESILTAVLKRKFDLQDAAVREVWSKLCAALVIASEPELLAKLTSDSEERGEADVRYHLWTVVAESWKSSEPSPSWQDTVKLLGVPLVSTRVVSESALEVWAELLDYAITAANAQHISVLEVLEGLLMQFSCAGKRLSDFPDVSLLILRRLRVTCSLEPYPTVTALVNSLLGDVYAGYHQHSDIIRSFLRQFIDIIRFCSAAHLISLLAGLSEGLCTWIHDTSNFLSDEDYNDIIIPLYTNALDVLSDYTLNSDALRSLSPFLTAVFVRCPPPALGPLAFRAFWETARLDGSCEIPESISACLQGLERAFGGTEVADPGQDQSLNSNPFVSNSLSRGGHLASQERPATSSTTFFGRFQPGQLDSSPEIPLPISEHRHLMLDKAVSNTSPMSGVSTSFHFHEQDSPTLGKRRARAGDGNSLGHDGRISSLPVNYHGARPRKRARLLNDPENPGKPVAMYGSIKRSQPLIPGVQAHLSQRPPLQDSVGSDEDYDSWEIGLDVDQLGGIPDEVAENNSVFNSYSKHDPNIRNIIDELQRSSSLPAGAMHGPQLRVSDGSQHQERHKRSQTAPEFRSSIPSGPRQSPCVARTSSTQIEALRRLYHAVRDGGSQMPVDEMLAANQLVNEIGCVLNEKLAKKLGDGTKNSHGKDVA
ncbi:hypothetical protein OBBRIDRAFT_837831 [Obba rivulosa]|uniref:Telomere-associated protein Rif1 N-terminal domain-containing protein n=1 Tax=Obba rivulosa TaxID=1052685 RepID=A0A8E2DHA5_9APHY|nr:hypothetical protein OBBRIDRAFT_837831 [Obba rivulosa]